MTAVYETVRLTLHLGDCRDVMAALPECSVDAVVTDPPYDLTMGKRGGSGDASENLLSPAGRSRATTGFMGKRWDGTGVAFDVETWAAALRVLKPGGHLLAFGAPRTYHRMACAIEDAGFEIRDCIMWLFGSGFPKSLDVSKAIDKANGDKRPVIGFHPSPGSTADRLAMGGGWQELPMLTSAASAASAAWEGWGTALKPAYEPVVLARKPLIGTVAANVLAHGTGGLNVDGCRIDTDWSERSASWKRSGHSAKPDADKIAAPLGIGIDTSKGRWPANVALDEEAARLLDAMSGAVGGGGESSTRGAGGGTYGANRTFQGDMREVGYGDTGGASRFFYTAKTSRAEREFALDDLGIKQPHEITGRKEGSAGQNNPRASVQTGPRRNDHPTVKPIDLMRWLCRLVTPPGGLVIDPFLGSGSTGMAALDEGFRFIGIDLEEHYLDIAQRRIARRHLIEPMPTEAADGRVRLL